MSSNIPENITRIDILCVIRDLDLNLRQVPPKERSTRYCLVYEGRHYPPKYLVRWANEKPNGKPLVDFYGGPETNNFLGRCGFQVIRHGGAPHS